MLHYWTNVTRTSQVVVRSRRITSSTAVHATSVKPSDDDDDDDNDSSLSWPSISNTLNMDDDDDDDAEVFVLESSWNWWRCKLFNIPIIDDDDDDDHYRHLLVKFEVRGYGSLLVSFQSKTLKTIYSIIIIIIYESMNYDICFNDIVSNVLHVFKYTNCYSYI